MEIRKEVQSNPVEDKTEALIAAILPILTGILYSTKREKIDSFGGYEKIKLRELAMTHNRPGSGVIGTTFEYAVHDAIVNQDAEILNRIETALKKCNIEGVGPQSILFGMEKASEMNGSLQIIETIKEKLTEDSLLKYGSAGRPAKLKRHIDSVAAAFRKNTIRDTLPTSINGLWRADLFLGNKSSDQWVGTTVKINSKDLEGAKGLRLGIIPSEQGKKDSIFKDEKNNLIIIPMPYDNSFMEVFYSAWRIVKQLLLADIQMPSNDADLPLPSERNVAKELIKRRDFPVKDVIDSLSHIAQHELISTNVDSASIFLRYGSQVATGTVIAPISKSFKPY